MKGRIRAAMKDRDTYDRLEVCAPLSRFGSDNLSTPTSEPLEVFAHSRSITYRWMISCTKTMSRTGQYAYVTGLTPRLRSSMWRKRTEEQLHLYPHLSRKASPTSCLLDLQGLCWLGITHAELLSTCMYLAFTITNISPQN